MINKKGSANAGSVVEELFSVQTGILIILGIGLLIGLFVVFGFVNRDNFFEKQVLAEELRLAVESVQLFEGNAHLYLFTPYNFSVEMLPGSVAIGEAPARQQGRYFVDKAMTYRNSKLATSDRLMIGKEGNSVYLASAPHKTNPHLRKCERPKNMTRLWSVTLDPGHGGNDFGLSYEGQQESEINKQLARRLRSFDQQFYGSSIRLDVDATVAVSDRNFGPATISLHLSNSSADDQYLRAYIHANENLDANYYLACNIMNELSVIYRDIGLKGISIVPVNPLGTVETNSHYALTQSSVGVEIEYGTIRDVGINDRLADIAQAIHRSVQTYGYEAIRN